MYLQELEKKIVDEQPGEHGRRHRSHATDDAAAAALGATLAGDAALRERRLRLVSAAERTRRPPLLHGLRAHLQVHIH